MKILITGGTGFLGSHIAEQQIIYGNEVVLLDNFATSPRTNLPTHERLKIVEGSVGDDVLVQGIFDSFQPDWVVHSAAAYKDPNDWASDIESNILGTANVVKASQRHAIKRFIYLQTALCYGKPLQKPIPISHRLQPFTSYAISKTSGEYYVEISGLPYVSLRLANVYGPRQYTGPMPIFYKRLREGKKCFVVDTRRDFIYITDFLSLIDRILAKPDVHGIFNVSSGSDNTIKEVFDLIVQYMGITLNEPVAVQAPDADDVSTLLLDPSATQAEFDWRAAYPLEDGLRQLIGWYDQYGVEAAYTHLRIGQDE